MNYKVISSCSTGNAAIIRDIILIDCGVTFKRLEKYYKQLKIVLLTHIHRRPFQKRNNKEISTRKTNIKICLLQMAIKTTFRMWS
jgi:hypothetical protein|nr:MAG TPA: hydroxyacylglutathione hydrolase [Caudoviricetes sp.]